MMMLSLCYFGSLQTFLEQTKSLFIHNYDGMPLNKITSTVGLNGVYYVPLNDSYLYNLSIIQCVVSIDLVARVEQGSIRLIFWDLGGQEDLQSLWDKVNILAVTQSCMYSIYVVNDRVRSVWHLATQGITHSSLLQYYAECQGVIYVVDSSDPENLAISSQTFSKECSV